MQSLQTLPPRCALYLQPWSFCGPDRANQSSGVQVAGLPVWASAFRLMARGDDGLILDELVSATDIEVLMGQDRGEEIEGLFKAITVPRSPWNFGQKTLRFNETRIMAVLNVTPDSFSDGGDFVDHNTAIAAAQAFAADGADIIDIGGESTRPGATTVWEGDELERVVPVIDAVQNSSVVVSLDTRKAGVMTAGLAAGADVINDVSAMRFDDASLPSLANESCPVILMHAQGEPQTMQSAPRYDDVVLDVYDALESRIEACVNAGIAKERLAIDPGIGFGKTVQHNLALINNLAIFHGLGCPLVLGVSRKRFIGALASVDNAKARFPGSLAAALKGVSQGVHILRVHDVSETVQALKVWRGLTDEMQMPPLSE